VLNFENATLVEPVKEKGLIPGLEYSYYEGVWDDLPDFAPINTVKSGIVSTISRKIKQRDDYFGITFTGYIEVNQKGVYTFFSNSSDGSKLWIGETLVVDNDKRHGPREHAGKIGLQKGKHPIRVEYFKANELEELEVSYMGPGKKKQILSAKVLFHPRSR
jgi:hypothetical protein